MPPCSPDVNLREVAEDNRLDGFTGADLTALVREASTEALKQRIDGTLGQGESIQVGRNHFLTALSKVRPSICNDEKVKYDRMERTYSQSKREKKAVNE